MDLGDRGGRDRFVVEACEIAVEWPTDRLLDRRPDAVERQGRDPVLKGGQRPDPVWTEKIAAHRQDLAEFHRHRTEVAKHGDHRFRAGCFHLLVASTAQAETGCQASQPVPSEDPDDLAETLPFADRPADTGLGGSSLVHSRSLPDPTQSLARVSSASTASIR